MRIDIASAVQNVYDQIEQELFVRAVNASNDLKTAADEVLRGQRTGATYKSPASGTYTASAPGEPPADRTTNLRGNWRPVQYGPSGRYPAIESNVPYAWLDKGSPGGKIKPRPYSARIIEMARPVIEARYAAPYNVSP